MLGEQTFDAAGQRWTLLLGNAAQCAIEEHYDRGFYAVLFDAVPNVDATTLLDNPAAMLEAMRKVRVSTLRDLAYFGLRQHHPDIDLPTVSGIIDDLGQAQFGEVLGKAIGAAMDKGGEAGATKGKPVTRAKRQTGQG